MSAHRERSSWNAVLALKRILVPTDFSKESKHAFGYAAALAEEFDASITLLFVLESAPLLSGMETVPLLADSSAILGSARKKLEEWMRAEFPKSVQTLALVQEGNAYSEIVRVAQVKDIDLIVLSTRGQTGVKHLLLGSTAERVVRHAPCPVLVVRAKDKRSRNLLKALKSTDRTNARLIRG